MKCGIVTVYNSENCGSFLQAYALSRAIHGMGDEAVFMKQGFNGCCSVLVVCLKNIVRASLKRNLKEAMFLKERCTIFIKMSQNHFFGNEPSNFHSDFDYAVTRPRIEFERENSLHYLKNAIESCGKNG